MKTIDEILQEYQEAPTIGPVWKTADILEVINPLIERGLTEDDENMVTSDKAVDLIAWLLRYVQRQEDLLNPSYQEEEMIGEH